MPLIYLFRKLSFKIFLKQFLKEFRKSFFFKNFFYQYFEASFHPFVEYDLVILLLMTMNLFQII